MIAESGCCEWYQIQRRKPQIPPSHCWTKPLWGKLSDSCSRVVADLQSLISASMHPLTLTLTSRSGTHTHTHTHTHHQQLHDEARSHLDCLDCCENATDGGPAGGAVLRKPIRVGGSSSYTRDPKFTQQSTAQQCQFVTAAECLSIWKRSPRPGPQPGLTCSESRRG